MLKKNEIITKLLDTSVEEVTVIPIVGVGGLGKTTLAQLVFNDEDLRKKFDMMLWVSVPHQIRKKEMIEDIIASATGGERPSNFNLEQLTSQLSRYITGKKYMLVLDDVWDEDPEKWESLKPLLNCSVSHGSKILVTTRSLRVGRIMGTVPSYELQPLNENESWSLFEKIVFQKQGHELGVRELVRKVLGLCKDVPLVIRVIAGVLANKLTVKEWSSFIANQLQNVKQYDNSVIPILKLSYDYLCPKLKTCFSYCSLFPRGYGFDKSRLVSLWIAQGFIDRLDSTSGSLEDEGKEYLDELVNKSFFLDESQGTRKLHDLMYDLCCLVAGGQCQVVSSLENSLGRSTRHVSIGYQVDSSLQIPTSLQSIKQLRTFLFAERPCYDTRVKKSICDKLITSFQCLRALNLHNLGIVKLPKSIGKLIHLRYLDLSDNVLLQLPNSVSLMHNLQYLDLRGCDALTMISRDFKTLVELRHLWFPSDNFFGSVRQTHYPFGLGGLTKLITLTNFCVVKCDSDISYGGCNKFSGGCLSDLRYLNNLEGELSIEMWSSYPNMALDAEEANLKAKSNLKTLQFYFPQVIGVKENEMMFENLQPHAKLLNSRIQQCQGVKFPTWMAMNQLASSLPHMASIEIRDCPNMQELPSFAHLPHLKSLLLEYLVRVEYIESGQCEASCSSSSSSSSTSSSIFFPSLTMLFIVGLRQLKGWSRSSTRVENLSFPRVSKVSISNCPGLESMPSCPNVEILNIGEKVNQNLEILKPPPAANNSSSSWVPKLKSLRIYDLKVLASLPREYVHQVTQLRLTGLCFEDSSTEEEYLKKAFVGFASIQSLVFDYCEGLMPISSIAHQLCTLQSMELWAAKFKYEENHSYDSWKLLKNLRSVLMKNSLYVRTELEGLVKGLQHVTALQSLELREYHFLGAIPEGIGNLSSLSSLELYNCPKLTFLPEDMRKLTNMKLLVVDNCPHLAPRCRKEIGEEWPNIQHIPEVIIWI